MRSQRKTLKVQRTLVLGALGASFMWQIVYHRQEMASKISFSDKKWGMGWDGAVCENCSTCALSRTVVGTSSRLLFSSTLAAKSSSATLTIHGTLGGQKRTEKQGLCPLLCNDQPAQALPILSKKTPAPETQKQRTIERWHFPREKTAPS